jgi:nucleoside-diphosphate-sugar epimerase
MRIVILGSGGFIGQNLVRNFLNRSDKIIAVVKNKNKNYFNYKNKIIYKHCNINNFQEVKKILKPKDVVYHLASPASIKNLYLNTRSVINTYLLGTINVMHACVEKKAKKLIILSSQEIYREPANMYTSSRLAADILSKAFVQMHSKLEIVIIRSSNVFGLSQSTKHIIPRFICRALLNKNLEVYGTEKIKKSFIYVGDLIKIIKLAEKKMFSNFNIINVSNPSILLSPKDIANKIIRYLKIKKNFVVNKNKFHMLSSESRLRYKKDFQEKLKFNLPFKFKKLEEILPTLITYYSKNLGRYKNSL